MSKIKVAINGFGRIGRLTTRYMLQNDQIEIVAINDLTDNNTLAHLFKYDTAHKKYNGTVEASEKHITIDGKNINAYAERDPSALPWKDLGVDIVLEATGVFRDEAGASKHINAGAKKVVISAPAKGDIKTVVLGVNDELITESDTILSNASCTTNCLAPMVKILDELCGIEHGLMTTTHAYTADQRLQDAPHSDLRRARAAAENIVPTSTGAAVAVGKVLPSMKGKLDGAAMRVPTITGSITELNCVVRDARSVETINARFHQASQEELNGVLEYTEEPLVSSDIVGNQHSCVFDSQLTMVMNNMVRVVGWYDNEAGYSSRLNDLITKLASN